MTIDSEIVHLTAHFTLGPKDGQYLAVACPQGIAPQIIEFDFLVGIPMFAEPPKEIEIRRGRYTYRNQVGNLLFYDWDCAWKGRA